MSSVSFHKLSKQLSCCIEIILIQWFYCVFLDQKIFEIIDPLYGCLAQASIPSHDWTESHAKCPRKYAFKSQYYWREQQGTPGWPSVDTHQGKQFSVSYSHS